MALKPIYDNYKIKRIVISTYQAVSGSGKKALDQLNSERQNKLDYDRLYPHIQRLDILKVLIVKSFPEVSSTQ